MRSDLALAALASAAVPGMKPVAVAGLVPDPHADRQEAVVEDATGRRWLVRSPLTRVGGARLRRGDELVRQLSRHVPFKVPAPVGAAAVGDEGHAVVYPHVEGLPLDLAHLPAGSGLASAVGRAVAAVHNVPPGVFEEQDVPTFDAAGCRQRLISEVDRASETGRVPTRLLARWEEAFDAAPLWQFATTPVHGSFRGATVLVAFADEDAASGRVVAVTDWEEAMVADPAVDLAELWSQASPAAWDTVLDAYTLARAQRPDAYLQARARLVAETRRLRGLAQAVDQDDEQTVRRVVEALRRMDRLTEDEDSLVPTTARSGSAPAVPSRSPRPEPQAAPSAPDPEQGPVPVGAASTGSGPAGQSLPEDATTEVPVHEALAAPGAWAAQTEALSGPDAQTPVAGEQPETSRAAMKHAETAFPEGEHDVASPVEAAAEDDVALLDDEDRLHELYGMPTPDEEHPDR